jgi:hypothetical protein
MAEWWLSQMKQQACCERRMGTPHHGTLVPEVLKNFGSSLVNLAITTKSYVNLLHCHRLSSQYTLFGVGLAQARSPKTPGPSVKVHAHKKVDTRGADAHRKSGGDLAHGTKGTLAEGSLIQDFDFLSL